MTELVVRYYLILIIPKTNPILPRTRRTSIEDLSRANGRRIAIEIMSECGCLYFLTAIGKHLKYHHNYQSKITRH